MALNERMRRFADEWLTGEHTGKQFHGVAAYEYAGYTISEINPSANPSKLLRHPDVQAYIKERLDEYSMSASEVLLRFTEIARAEVGDVVTKNAHGRLEIDPDAVVSNKRFIKSFGFDSNGNPKIDFHDSMAALQQIARIRGMLKDGLEVSGPGGAPMAMTVRFVNPDGSEAALGPTNEQAVEPEDFSEYDD